ncbi:MAG: hypothetical protein ACREPQ_09810 [Rhodanobacter sp.]
MKYADMDDQARLEWGLKESDIRKVDLAADRSAEGLKFAQGAAIRRRLEIGATRGQATAMVIDANRRERAARA